MSLSYIVSKKKDIYPSKKTPPNQPTPSPMALEISTPNAITDTDTYPAFVHSKTPKYPTYSNSSCPCAQGSQLAEAENQ